MTLLRIPWVITAPLPYSHLINKIDRDHWDIHRRWRQTPTGVLPPFIFKLIL